MWHLAKLGAQQLAKLKLGAVGRNMCSRQARPRARHLQVVGKLSSSRVSRVHRDEHGACPVEGDVAALEHEALQFLHDSVLDAENLLGDHGQHLDLCGETQALVTF